MFISIVTGYHLEGTAKLQGGSPTPRLGKAAAINGTELDTKRTPIENSEHGIAVEFGYALLNELKPRNFDVVALQN